MYTSVNQVLLRIKVEFEGGLNYIRHVSMKKVTLLLHSLSTLRERLRTHKVFTKDPCFYLNYR